MAEYRKKQVVIEATQWFKNGDHPEDNSEPFSIADQTLISGGEVVRYFRDPKVRGLSDCKHCGKGMVMHGWIDAIQGGHIVCPGDWVITDNRVKETDRHGHYYPCKPDIFEATYEKVEK